MTRFRHFCILLLFLTIQQSGWAQFDTLPFDAESNTPVQSTETPLSSSPPASPRPKIDNTPLSITSAPPKQRGITNRLFPRDTQIRIAYKSDWTVNVLSFGKPSEGLSPVDFWDDEAKQTVLFTGPPGQYLVLAYERTSGRSTQDLITISSGNDPGPPKPDDPPTPPPTPDVVPTDLPNTYGLGRIVYLYARKANTPSDALKLAEAYSSALIKLNRLSVTVPQAEESVRTVRESLPAWADLDEQLEPALNKAIEQYGSSPAIYTRYFYEISEALSRSTK